MKLTKTIKDDQNLPKENDLINYHCTCPLISKEHV